jgi:hypothetical protein
MSSLLVGCPPQHYMRVTNETKRAVKVDFSSQGSGTFLPHFVLQPGESRRVSPPAREIAAHDLDGHLIGKADLNAISNWMPYYSKTEPYTFKILVTSSAVMLLRGR